MLFVPGSCAPAKYCAEGRPNPKGEAVLPLSTLVNEGSWLLYGDFFAREWEVAFEEAWEVSLSDDPGRWPFTALSPSGDLDGVADLGAGCRAGGSILVDIVSVVSGVNETAGTRDA